MPVTSSKFSSVLFLDKWKSILSNGFKINWNLYPNSKKIVSTIDIPCKIPQGLKAYWICNFCTKKPNNHKYWNKEYTVLPKTHPNIKIHTLNITVITIKHFIALFYYALSIIQNAGCIYLINILYIYLKTLSTAKLWAQ